MDENSSASQKIHIRLKDSSNSESSSEAEVCPALPESITDEPRHTDAAPSTAQQMSQPSTNARTNELAGLQTECAGGRVDSSEVLPADSNRMFTEVSSLRNTANAAMSLRAECEGSIRRNYSQPNARMNTAEGIDEDVTGFLALTEDLNEGTSLEDVLMPPSPLNHASLCIPEEEPISLTETRRPSDADKVYTFLECLPVKTIRNFCKELQIVQKGLKSVVVERVFVTMGHIGSGKEFPWDVAIREVARKCEARSYDDWLADNCDLEN